MIEKLIINNETDLPMVEILPIVQGHIDQGRVSAKDSYCLVCTWEDGIISIATKNKNSDTIRIIKEGKHER